MSSALHHLDTPTQTLPTRYLVFGRDLTLDEVYRLSAELHRRGDYEAGKRALREAGKTPHDLIEWSRHAE